MARRAEPVRTCVGCRSRAASVDLLRIVVVDGELVPDVRRRLPGRGAHLHRNLACLDLAERRKAFPRAFRLPGPLRAARVRDHVERTASVPTGMAGSAGHGTAGHGSAEHQAARHENAASTGV